MLCCTIHVVLGCSCQFTAFSHYGCIGQVPLFHGMDDLTLDNICDRLRPLVFSNGEKVIREGDPVQRMVFILQGKLRSTQPLAKGVVATC